MKQVLLGASGLGTSIYALGTATFGESTDEAEAGRMLDAFTDLGGLLVDTADAYADGRAEQIVGRWLARQPAGKRGRLLLSTKGGGYTTSAAMNEWGNTRYNLSRALDQSLARLGVESVALYQMHTWDPLTPLEETLSFLDGALRQGKIQYVGLSNFLGWQIQKAVDLAKELGLAGPVSYQAQYNLLCREVEWEVIPAGQANRLGLMAWSPLSGGLLTDKYSSDRQPKDEARFTDSTHRGKMHDNYVNALYRAHAEQDRTWNVLKILRAIATSKDVTPAAIALAWVAARPGVSGVMLGARNAQQLQSNLAARDVVLAQSDLALLDEASDPRPAGYPYGSFGAMQRSRSLQ